MGKVEKVLMKEFMQRWSEISQVEVSSLNWQYETFVKTIKSFINEKRPILLKNFLKLEERKGYGTRNFHNLYTGEISERNCEEKIGSFRASLSTNLKYPEE